MPAVSKAQRRYLAMQEHMPASERTVKMSKKQFHEFTAVKEKDLPNHKAKGPSMTKRR